MRPRSIRWRQYTPPEAKRLCAMQAEGRVRSFGSLSNRVKVWEVVG